jgi:hypothetical protein
LPSVASAAAAGGCCCVSMSLRTKTLAVMLEIRGNKEQSKSETLREVKKKHRTVRV